MDLGATFSRFFDPEERRVVQLSWLLISYTLFGALAAGEADYTHFTWWSQATFAAYSLLGVFGIEIEYFFFFQALQIQIIMAVLLMSFNRCDVFVKAGESHYEVEYIMGNFALHYAPFLVAFALAPASKIDGTKQRLTAHVWSSLALFNAWIFFYEPWDIYGCNGLPAWIFSSLPLLIVVLINWVILYTFVVEEPD